MFETHLRPLARRRSRILTVLVLLAFTATIPSCRHGVRVDAESVADAGPSVTTGTTSVVVYPHPLELTASVSYDGPNTESLTFRWEQSSGPGDVVFSHTEDTSTQAVFSTPGTYGLRFTASDGTHSDTGDWIVKVVAAVATYYLSPEGSDDNDGQSVMSPFRTIARAAAVVRPGDVVLLRGGTYEEYDVANAWITSGTPEKPITFKNYPGEAPVIDGSFRPRNPSSTNPSAPELIRLVGIDWYVFDGLTFRNSGGRGLSLEGNHNVARNISSHSNNGDGIFIRGDDNLVEDSLVFDNYSRSNGGESADGIKIDSGSNNVVRNVVSYSNSDDGFDFWASTNTLAERNIAHHNGRGPHGNGNGFKLSSLRVNSHNVIRFNVSHSNRNMNFTDNAGGGLFVYNNTSWNAGQFGFVFRGQTGLEQSEVINNISFEDRNGVLIDVQTKGGILPLSRTNTWDLGIADPGFVTVDMNKIGFLKLELDGAAVDVGTDVGFPFRGEAMDLGAFEAADHY